MNQLTQKLKTGDPKILEVPLPVLKKGNILVKNHYSLISVGTEVDTVKAAKKGYIGKAKERPQQLKQVVHSLKVQGPIQTYRAVMKKLEAYSPLGYSSAGEVIELSSDVKGLYVGDFVACGGNSASHAEIVSVPNHLCVKLKPDADLKQAAYNTLGAIALQGLRQADLRLGETCAIVGLGLIGQLTALLLRASGIRVVGIDIDANMVDFAKRHCVELALDRSDAGIEDKIAAFTDGLGCDAVIIAAASKTLDPINFAGAVARKRGTIVVVGNVPTGFAREPHFYKKELQVKMSCSFGPGRYDPVYEEKGVDYPPAYVRWTEKRNMQAFQELIYTKKVDVSYLTTHDFKLDHAPDAYEMIINKSEPFIGILIEYDTKKKVDDKLIFCSNLKAKSSKLGTVSIGFIGAGAYAQGHLLPNMPKSQDIILKGVMTTTGGNSRSVAERFGFEFCTTDAKDILENADINTVFIATRHDSHAYYVIEGLKAGKHVFVEKPLCLTFDELAEIRKSYELSTISNQILIVGYNRRFSPLVKKIKEAFRDGPMAMLYRVNSGKIPVDSWIQDPDVGGGRIIGEACHFIDFLTHINGSIPLSVYANAMSDPNHLNDTLNVSLYYKNGSIGTISYFANGDKSLPKERVEIYANSCTAVMDDFKTLTIHANNKRKVKKLFNQDKGQKTEVEQFIKAILNGKRELIPFDEIINTSLVTFRIVESIRTGDCMKM